MVVYSPLSGVVSQLMYKPGDVAHKGKPLIMIETDEESVKGLNNSVKIITVCRCSWIYHK